ncbi:hypothetical protein PVAP13_4NG265911 [Panicum virgatum]|uniref:Uncharacterized protein n=1 Tax=Panicum virgatum TaxID=38727 RepID=A0A8T0T9M9_PANVG|nr:hypothetical protein PVAP13_4NG265911 [Panicum virgatum]
MCLCGRCIRVISRSRVVVSPWPELLSCGWNEKRRNPCCLEFEGKGTRWRWQQPWWDARAQRQQGVVGFHLHLSVSVQEAQDPRWM